MAGVSFPGQAKTISESMTNQRMSVANNKVNDDNQRKTPSASSGSVSDITSTSSGTSKVSKLKKGQKAVSESDVAYNIEALPNPLGDYSSSTYQISLYMSTPDAINRFVESGRFNLSDDHYIVAQSGGIGINEKRGLTNTGNIGPGEMGMDYYIDDFELHVVLTGTDGTPTIGTSMKFKIIEPIGFNLFAQLSTISGKINEKSEIIKKAESARKSDEPSVAPPPLSQNYMIGIRFYGYDAAGNLMTAKEHKSFYGTSTDYNKSTINDYANFEYFYTFQITSVTYQIDGRIVTYFFEGTPIAKQIGHGSKFGLLNSAATVVAGTVGEALKGGNGAGSNTSRSIMQIMQEQEAEKVSTKRAEKEIKYDIIWDNNTKPLYDAKLTDDPMFKTMAPGSGAANTKQVNPKTAQAAQSINTGKKELKLPQGTVILQVMDQIMAKSTYVTEKLLMQNDESIESKSNPSASESEIQWYSINPVVKLIDRDNITKDWVYDIKYYITMQRIEYIRALYVNRTSRWRGVHKEYNFFLTGQNTEIISFEQKYDNQFYLLQAMSTNTAVINKKNKVPAHLQGGTTNKPIGGSINRGDETAANVANRMNSIADQATANIKILGDPHYLMSNVGGIEKFASGAFAENYHASAITMNPYHNQIWIRILFNGSTDYNKGGTIDINSLDFYSVVDSESKLPKNSEIKGLIYRVLEVTSNFVGGRFSQTLELILVGENMLNVGKEEEESTKRETAYSESRTPQWRRTMGATAEEIAEWNKKNESKPRVNPMNASSSIAQGVSTILNKPEPTAAATLTELQNSKVYIEARKNGMSARDALELAKQSAGVPTQKYPTVDDDAKPMPTLSQMQQMEKAEAAQESARNKDIDRRLAERARQQRDNPRSIYGNRDPINPPTGE